MLTKNAQSNFRVLPRVAETDPEPKPFFVRSEPELKPDLRLRLRPKIMHTKTRVAEPESEPKHFLVRSEPEPGAGAGLTAPAPVPTQT